MKDKDIRKILIEWIKEVFNPTNIREEMPTGTTRLDLTAFNKDTNTIYGFEIKSDKDTTNRLERQSWSYDKVCDFCYIVTTKKYVEKVANIVTERWGIILIEENKVSVIREPQRNKYLDKRALLNLCWKKEILRAISCRNKHLLASQYVTAIAEVQLSTEEIKQMVFDYAMYKRTLI
jgi:hypothetical protein